MEEPAPKHEQSDVRACRRLWSKYLARQIDDFIYCRRGGEIPNDGCRMPPAERARLWCELYSWFFDTDDADEIGTLSWTCAVIGISVERVRARLGQQLGDNVQIRRRRLDRQERAAILQLLRKGRTTTEICRRFRVDVSVIRKHRHDWRLTGC